LEEEFDTKPIFERIETSAEIIVRIESREKFAYRAKLKRAVAAVTERLEETGGSLLKRL
jgi:hypothetical protein